MCDGCGGAVGASAVGETVGVSAVGRAVVVATPLLEECEDDTHTLEMGTWESSATPETSKLDCRGQNTSHRGVFYIIEKL
jgi:hypothetical protein